MKIVSMCSPIVHTGINQRLLKRNGTFHDNSSIKATNFMISPDANNGKLTVPR